VLYFTSFSIECAEFYDVVEKEIRESKAFTKQIKKGESGGKMTKAEKLVDMIWRSSDFANWALSMKAMAMVRRYMDSVD
jgi:hypothetical protein